MSRTSARTCNDTPARSRSSKPRGPDIHDRAVAREDGRPRPVTRVSRDEIAALLPSSLRVIPPGLVPVKHWRTDEPVDGTTTVGHFYGIAGQAP